MNSRHERRAELSRFRREASVGLTTFLVEPGDGRLGAVPLLQRASRHWLAGLSVKVRSCIVCSEWLWSADSVGLVLLSTPAVARPVSASVSGICVACAELPLPALEQATLKSLQAALPGAYFAAEGAS